MIGRGGKHQSSSTADAVNPAHYKIELSNEQLPPGNTYTMHWTHANHWSVEQRVSTAAEKARLAKKREKKKDKKRERQRRPPRDDGDDGKGGNTGGEDSKRKEKERERRDEQQFDFNDYPGGQSTGTTGGGDGRDYGGANTRRHGHRTEAEYSDSRSRSGATRRVSGRPSKEYAATPRYAQTSSEDPYSCSSGPHHSSHTSSGDRRTHSSGTHHSSHTSSGDRHAHSSYPTESSGTSSNGMGSLGRDMRLMEIGSRREEPQSRRPDDRRYYRN
jgi:hypothetical protein